MEKNEKPIPDGYMQDAQARLVPIEHVAEIDRLRDALVREIVESAQAESQRLARFKSSALADIEAFVEISAEKYNKSFGGSKGNLTLTTYDGQFRIVRAIEEYFFFDERIQVAKDLIDQCIHDWSQGARSEIRALVNDAFQVDKQGRINTKRILGLRRLDIDDERWKSAMQAISDSLQASGSNTYIRVYQRDAAGKYRQIDLSASAA